MAQLTGSFTGTLGKDSFSGSINNEETTVVDGIVTGIAVEQLILDTLGGPDRITATTNFFARPFLPALAIGMTNADINTGTGRDRVTVSSEGNSLESTISIGVQNTLIETGADRDIITISSDGNASFAGGSIPATSTAATVLSSRLNLTQALKTASVFWKVR